MFELEKYIFFSIIFFIVINFVGMHTMAQNSQQLLTLKGQVYDEKTQKPVYYVNVGIKGTKIETLTNLKGQFSLHYPIKYQKDTLLITSVAYQAFSFPLSEVNIKDTLKISLKSAIYTLGEITVIGYNAQQIVEKALAKLPENTPQTPFVMDAFYRQYHRENDRYVRLIETDLSIYDKGYAKRFAQNRFKLNELRRSKVYERNGAAHSNHLKELLELNVVKHRQECILSKRGLKEYDVEVEGIYYYQNQPAYCIRFQAKKTWNAALESGFLWIRKTDFAIVRMEIDTEMVDLSPPSTSWNNSMMDLDHRYEWQKQEQQLRLSFEEKNGKMYPSEMVFFYQHKLYDKFNQKVRFIVDEHFELYVYGIREVPESLKKYKFFKNVYYEKYKYNQAFWNNYLPVLNHPLHQTVIKDLEHKTVLEKQFEKNSR